MTPTDLPEMIAAMACFGVIVVCPLVMLLLRHQRQMAELIHRNPDNDSHRRLEVVEHELRELRAAQHELTIKNDDKKSLGPGDSL